MRKQRLFSVCWGLCGTDTREMSSLQDGREGQLCFLPNFTLDVGSSDMP